MLHFTRFRIEQTKVKLDKYYTGKGLHPEFHQNMDPEENSEVPESVQSRKPVPEFKINMSNVKTLLLITDEIKTDVRKLYNKNEEDIKIDVGIIQNWLKMQSHLPTEEDSRIERFILRNKFQVERTKQKLDKYFTYRGLYSEFFLNADRASESIQNVRKSLMWAPMPNLLPTMERIIAVSFLDKEAKFYNVSDTFTYMLCISDILLSHDYASAYRMIVDLSNIGIRHIAKMDVNTITKGMFLYQEACSGRLSYIEFVNIPPVFDMFYALLKRALNAKVFNKIRTYRNFVDLYKEVPIQYLPEEFGGDQESMFEVQEKWSKELIFQKDFLLENNRKVSNENLRVGEPIHNELFGVDGTFKTLNLVKKLELQCWY